ncbi:MAG: FkbM family methyltransferase [Gammaproteobacteria bacterium]|jgi:FkbM family methyltransferase
MIKNILIRVLSFFYKKMPCSIQDLLLKVYCDSRGDFNVLNEVANRLNIKSIGVEGGIGEIYGSIMDKSIIAKYAKTGIWSKRTLELLNNFFKEKVGTYIDIGANIGLTTLPVAMSTNVKCIAFEPDPKNFRYLEQNILNVCPTKSIESYNVAISDKSGIVTFELSPHNLGDHRLRLESKVNLLGEDKWKTINVQAKRLDDFNFDIKSPLAIKIDVQGAEPLVIAGGNKILESANLIILEFSPYWMNRMGTNPAVVIDFVSNFPKATIAQGELENFEEFSTGKIISNKLSSLYNENKNISVGAYWDIILLNEQ